MTPLVWWRDTPPHAVSKVVTPALTVALIRPAAGEFDPPGKPGPPTVIETETPHYFVAGDTVRLAGTSSTPPLDGDHAVIAASATAIAIELDITAGGTGGTVVRLTAVEPLTVAQGKLLAGLDWPDGDPRDDLMAQFIRAARAQVELDIGQAMLAQMRDVSYDALPQDAVGGIALPQLCVPLQAIVSISVLDDAGTAQTIPPTSYLVDLTSGRFALTGELPAARAFQPWTVRVVAGRRAISDIPPPLMQAIGLLTAHYATFGRDLVIATDRASDVPHGYEDAIWPFKPVVI